MTHSANANKAKVILERLLSVVLVKMISHTARKILHFTFSIDLPY
jgi:hypothetical protein